MGFGKKWGDATFIYISEAAAACVHDKVPSFDFSRVEKKFCKK